MSSNFYIKIQKANLNFANAKKITIKPDNKEDLEMKINQNNPQINTTVNKTVIDSKAINNDEEKKIDLNKSRAVSVLSSINNFSPNKKKILKTTSVRDSLIVHVQRKIIKNKTIQPINDNLKNNFKDNEKKIKKIHSNMNLNQALPKQLKKYSLSPYISGKKLSEENFEKISKKNTKNYPKRMSIVLNVAKKCFCCCNAQD